MSLSRACLARVACALLCTAPVLAEPPAPQATTTTVATERAWTRLIFDRALLAGYGFEIDPANLSHQPQQ